MGCTQSSGVSAREGKSKFDMKQQALDYHSGPIAGKFSIKPTKAMGT